MFRFLSLAVIFATAAAGFYLATGGQLPQPIGLLVCLLLSVAPGAAIYRLAERRAQVLEGIAGSLALSPVIVAGMAAILIVLGVGTSTTTMVLIGVATGLATLAASVQRDRPRWELSTRHATLLALTLLAVCAITAYLPMSSEWWRVRSDAWFHGAVVAEIGDFGLPPQDPYFAGMPLQYMWCYHVLVLVLSKASGIDPFFVMFLLNIHALIVFGLGAFMLSSLFRRRFAYNYSSLLMVLFGMNALFWLFMPIKLARALTGEVTGMDEISRVLSLRPFDGDTVRAFLSIFYNQTFFLDKFIVATALPLGLGSMAMLWYASVRYLTAPSPYPLWLAAIACLGLMAFHPLIGMTSFAAVIGGLLLMRVASRRIDGYRPRVSARLALLLIAAVALSTPYLYSITHAKSGDNVFPLILSWTKIVGLIISVALGGGLAVFQIRRLLATPNVAHAFFVGTALSIIAIGLFANFPGANLYTKPPFLVFFPLAIVGGWTLVDFAARVGRRPTVSLVWLYLAAFAPINVLALTAYYHTEPRATLSDDERTVAAWVRENTARDALFFDSADRVFLLVPGPRRYYWGRQAYAMLWGYDRVEMEHRRHVRDSLYAEAPLDSGALTTLGTLPADVYVMSRNEPGGRIHREPPTAFDTVFSHGTIEVYRVNRDVCRSLGRDSDDRNTE